MLVDPDNVPDADGEEELDRRGPGGANARDHHPEPAQLLVKLGVEPVLEDADGSFVFSGRAHVRELAERIKIDVEGEGYETAAGYLLAHVGRVPAVGETFEIDGLSVEVLEAERRRITRVRVRRTEQPTVAAAESSE